jgi:hypothetical protein
MVRCFVSQIVALKGDVGSVVDAVIDENDEGVRSEMLEAIAESGFNDVDRLTALLRGDDMLREATFRMFVKVGRADLLLSMAIGGDQEMTERVRRCMSEQGYI